MTRTSKRLRIAVVTGTRAEYGLLGSTLDAIAASKRLELQLVACGMHLLPRFGRTVSDIRRDGWRIDAIIPMQRGDDGHLDQAEGLARGVAGMARFFERARTDVVLVLGDRIEAMAAALAATTTGRILAHVHGGDIAPGDIDDALRHSITKLAHVHFPATRDAARRIVRMGERSANIHCVGAPGLDDLGRKLTGADLCSAHSADGRANIRFARLGSSGADLRSAPARGTQSANRSAGFALVCQHPSGRAAAIEARTMAAILNAVTARGLRRVIVYPNSDRGCSGVIAAIERHVAASPRDAVEIHRSLPRDQFLDALLTADVLIGNSSAGIIEAPFAGARVVNVGTRQRGRKRGGPGVVTCGESPTAIRAALHRALRLRPRRGPRTPYGDGRAGQRIARALELLDVTPALRRKQIAY
jgi:UDP-N-acetylglucosamine 2-epimerase (non-hydrolysing)/GDP/UDP-N,N'-diacetylbacillosamine 2-epimerase (hydrolysing)